MKVKKRQLQHALNSVGKTVGEKTPKEDCKMVVFDIKSTGTKLTTWNITSGSQFELESLTGDVLFKVGYKEMSSVVSCLDGEISLTIKENKLYLKSKKRKLSVSLINGGFDHDIIFDVDFKEYGDELVSSMAMVKNCVSSDTSQFILNSVYIGPEAVVCTDRRRMGVVDTDIGFTAIIPANGAMAIEKLFAGEKIKCCATDSSIYVTNGKLTVFFNQTDGDYPNYKRVMSLKPDKVATFNSDELRSLVESMSNLGDVDRVIVDICDQKMGVSCKSNNYEIDYSDEIGVSSETDVKFLFDRKYLESALNAFRGEVKLMYTNGESPCWFTVGNLIQMVAPLRQ